MSGWSLQQIEIRRLPGFEQQGFLIEDLSPGVNLVHGPNASGKSSTVRAVLGLLWPGALAPPRASLRGELQLDGVVWTIDLDGGNAIYRCAGAESGPPALPDAEAGRRCCFALHELLVDDNQPLAEVILRESAGGYDVSAAADVLGFREKASRAPKVRDAYRAAVQKANDIRAAQQQLAARGEELAELRRRRDEAATALQRAELLKHAAEHARAAAALRAARERFETFPAGLAQMTGRESEQLADLRARRRDAEQRRDDARRRLSQAQSQRQASGLEDAVAGELLPALRERVQRLEQLQHERARAEQELAAARTAEESERAAIGPAIAADRLAGLDAVAMDELAGFARRALQLEEERIACEAAAKWLDDAEQQPEAEQLPEGYRLVQRWLRSPQQGPSPLLRGALAASGVWAILLAGLSGILVHGAFWLLAAAGIVPLLLAWRAGQHVDERPLLRQLYEKLPLPQPARWTSADVERLADDLGQRLARGLLRQKQEARWDALAERRRQLDAQLAELEPQRAAIIQRFGVAPDSQTGTVYWLANRISRWQDAHRAVEAAAARSETAGRQFAETLAAVNGDLARYGYSPAADAAGCHGAIEDLQRRGSALQQAAADEALAEDQLRRAEADLQEATGQWNALFQTLGLDEDDEETLLDWSEQRDAYLEAREDLQAAQFQADHALRQLRAQPDATPELEEAEPATLEAECREARRQGQDLEELARQVTEIETLVNEARGRTELQEAVAEVGRCRDALAAARDADYERVAGYALAEFVGREIRDREQPAVFHLARQRFAEVTRGAYRLEIDDNPTAFHAVETASGQTRSLEELSSGTRVQLLLAVRMAFLERNEHDAPLPLLLDETLGNADDRRAEAIIEAALAICRAGRQVFYFTAQTDELAKWRAILKDHTDVPCREIDLSELRGLQEARRAPLPETDAWQPAPPPPAPAGDDHHRYGQRLGVAAFDPQLPIGELHVWHLAEDPAAVHRLLTLGIERWGQLQALWEAGGSKMTGLDLAAYQGFAAAARLLEELARLWQQGRGKPVDREALRDCEAVSDTFLERVADLAASVEGDAARLLEALEDGQVKRFRTDACAKLRQELVEGGYLDEAEVLPPEKLRIQALSAAGPDIHEGLLTIPRAEQLINKLVPSAQHKPHRSRQLSFSHAWGQDAERD